MITIDSDPEVNPVSLGAHILTHLADNAGEVELGELYNVLKYSHGISYDVYVYTLDWLYAIGAVDLNDDERLVCF
ncbi:hypothetical protein PJK54_02865 [Cobetia sp. MMG027]|uniref:ABC-three component system middle component 6 n=1 Tax=Cobetia sp. MMG027 TaxID=3021980 RepID=UPI0022FE3074|nr:ABC-three component system middle component 6 [Cobetia sp. MMG027]MDA5562609.1 hypothetical protein [Cobetia sp. MMG027]